VATLKKPVWKKKKKKKYAKCRGGNSWKTKHQHSPTRWKNRTVQDLTAIITTLGEMLWNVQTWLCIWNMTTHQHAASETLYQKR